MNRMKKKNFQGKHEIKVDNFLLLNELATATSTWFLFTVRFPIQVPMCDVN